MSDDKWELGIHTGSGKPDRHQLPSIPLPVHLMIDPPAHPLPTRYFQYAYRQVVTPHSGRGIGEVPRLEKNTGTHPVSSSPSSPTMRLFRTVAILSNLMTESTFRPVSGNPRSPFVIRISAGERFRGTFEEINAITTSYSFSHNTRARRIFAVVKSVKGNGRITIFPLIDRQPWRL